MKSGTLLASFLYISAETSRASLIVIISFREVARLTAVFSYIARNRQEIGKKESIYNRDGEKDSRNKKTKSTHDKIGQGILTNWFTDMIF